MIGMIKELKQAANKLEKAYNSYDKVNFEIALNYIKEISDQIEYSHDRQDKVTKNDLVHFDVINTIPFLVKMVEPNVDVYEGTYLEKFCERRTDELMRSRAINNHNAFWKLHTTIAGNIYGSVPLELLKTENVDLLEGFGWVTVEVDIIDTSNIEIEHHQLVKFILEYVDNYVVVKENSTNTLLVLRYNI